MFSFLSTAKKEKVEYIATPFKLPISYVETKPISKNVLTDLELSLLNEGNETEEAHKKTMYDVLLEPSHIFAKRISKDWTKSFTDNIEYLENTQSIIRDYDSIHKPWLSEPTSPSSSTFLWSSSSPSPHFENIDGIWREIQDDNDFKDRFGFMEWEILEHLNYSSSFLQMFSLIQMVSPILSLLMPFFILFFPFILLSIQGESITFELYIKILRDIAKNHFIGKLLSIRSLNSQNIMYMIISIVFYFFSTYQNIIASIKFYNNIKNMNNHLMDLKNYLNFVYPRMDSFIQLHQTKPQYTEFCNVSQKHSSIIKEFTETLAVHPFSHSYQTFQNLGEMLKLYYRIFTDSVIKESIEYSFGFEGYLDNLRSLSEHIKKGDLAFATFSTDTATTIEKQYYPSFMNGTPIKNDVSLEKNIIITGPNASGKTTMLKTTTLNIIFSQQFGCGFYDTATIKPYTHIHSYLNIPDTSERDSLFQAESRRCKDILTSIQSTDKGTGTEAHHLCIFDELYSGTNYKDATKSATSFLKYLSKNKTVDYLLTTHYTLVCKNLESNKRIQLCKMDVEVLEGGEFVYLYKMKKGISEIEGGVNILKEMDYPEEIINSIMNEKENGDEKEKESDN